MSEQNSDRGQFIRRQKDASAPSSVTPMKRQTTPGKPAQNPYLSQATPQEELTAEQLQPLSKRPKPLPADDVFPEPLPSRPTGAAEPVQFHASTATPSGDPMLRHTVRTGYKADWKYTRADSVINVKETGGDIKERRKEERNGDVSAAVVKMPINKKPLILSAIAILVALVVILGCIFGIVPAAPSAATVDLYSDKPAAGYSTVLSSLPSGISNDEPAYEYAANTVVGYSSKVVKTLEPEEVVKPAAEPANQGLVSQGTITAYPTYGSTLNSIIGGDSTKRAARQALIREAGYLASANTSNGGSWGAPQRYNMMDADGKLWYHDGTTKTASLVSADGEQRTLYEHTAAASMYLGGHTRNGVTYGVFDDAPRVVKTVTMRARGYDGYGVTGLYAPAGEVIKVEISKKDMEATKGLTFHIGQALYNGQANNIWADKNQMQRFPMILNTMVLNTNTTTYDAATETYTGYIGSFLGGPVYIRNSSVKYTATISGGVEYLHFILGYTTEAEFNDLKKNSTVPYFDLEVWDRGVLHSGPRYYAEPFSYDDLYKAAVLWEKVASVTTYKSDQGIVFLYDPFVAAGAAVAFPGRRSVNCPMDWMTSSLNYNGIVTSGSWGNFHEYHHNFQGYGVGNGGEVTNNALNLVSYALFTKISAKRGISNYGTQGLGDWNNYTSATWALNEVLKIPQGIEPSNGKQGLALYATLLHNFGADAFMNAKVFGGGQSYAAYMNAWQSVTHNNMYYYFHDLLDGTGISNNADSSYPVFVPVSSVYQTGRSYTYDGEKRYFQTMRPYVIAAGQDFNIDLTKYSAPNGQYASGSVVIPDGFTYRIKSVSKPENGKISIVDNYHLKYTPSTDSKKKESGKIVVTLEIVKDDGAFKVDDVDLVLEFEQSHEMNKMTLERTTYTFDDAHMYTDVVEAYNSNFKGALSKVESDHTNPTQNCNTDVWLVPDTDKGHSDFPNAKEQEIAKLNQIIEVKGKLYFAEKGKYRIYLRGRVNCALYYSTDGGKSYKLGATVKNGSGAAFYLNDPKNPNAYFDIEVEAESWLYYKSAFITLIANQTTIGYMGLGVGQWTMPQYTQVEKYYDKDGKEITDPSSDQIDHTKTQIKYYNNAGTEVSAEVVAAATLTPPTSASYVNAYRSNYEFPDNSSFESDFFYVRNYNYNYVGDPVNTSNGTSPTPLEGVNNYKPWTAETHDISHLFDGDLNTIIFFDRSWQVSEKNPAILAFDMGKEITANSMTLFVDNVTPSGNGIKGFPAKLNLQGSLDGENWFEMGNWSPGVQPSVSYEYLFDKEATFRYFKLTMTATCSISWNSGTGLNRIALSEMQFNHTLRLNGNSANHIAPDNDCLRYKGKWDYERRLSSFGYAYVGVKGSKITFEMIGTRLAILTHRGESEKGVTFTDNYAVYIDGKLCPNYGVKADSGDYAVSYISQKLSSGSHKVEIRCKGTVAFDSFAIYDEDA